MKDYRNQGWSRNTKQLSKEKHWKCVNCLLFCAKRLGKVRETNTSVGNIKNSVDILQENIANDPVRFQARASANTRILEM